MSPLPGHFQKAKSQGQNKAQGGQRPGREWEAGGTKAQDEGAPGTTGLLCILSTAAVTWSALLVKARESFSPK